MKIVNLTHEDISFVDDNGKRVLSVFSRGNLPKININRKQAGFIYNLIPICEHEVDYKIINLPNPEKETIFIVPDYIARQCPERVDFYSPDDAVVDKDGVLIGFKSLAKFSA